MNRLIASALLLVSIQAALGESPVSEKPAKPIGKWVGGNWVGKPVNGDVSTLTVGENGLTFVLEFKHEGDLVVTTMKSPAYAISDDGHVFGYLTEAHRVRNGQSVSVKNVTPFSFIASIKGDVLTMSEMRFVGIPTDFNEKLELKLEKSEQTAQSGADKKK